MRHLPERIDGEGGIEVEISKRLLGQYYTQRSVFEHPVFLDWAARAGLPGRALIEPFAGAGNIIEMLREVGLVGTEVLAFDIAPAAPYVQMRDCFSDYPEVDGVVVTNPPYMARNSAGRRGLPFPATSFADLYLHALDLMLRHHGYVAAIVPAAFGTTMHFRARLTHFIALPFNDMFGDTSHPVCLALFEPESPGAAAWCWTKYLGGEEEIRAVLPHLPKPVRVRFNDPKGLVGLLAADGPQVASIRFVPGAEIPAAEIKHSSRFRTRLTIEGVAPDNVDAVISEANRQIDQVRQITHDAILTPFRGVRADGAFRRRLDFRTARLILSIALSRAGDFHFIAL